MANRKGKSGSGDGFYFGGAPKFSVDGDCSHEIKTLLLLGRKAMRNLDITLPTKICIPSGVGNGSPLWYTGLENPMSHVQESRGLQSFRSPRVKHDFSK